MSYASKIIDRLGGTRAAARLLALKPTTVQSWKESGLIPAKHHQLVLDRARENGIDLAPEDFFEEPAEPNLPFRGAHL